MRFIAFFLILFAATGCAEHHLSGDVQGLREAHYTEVFKQLPIKNGPYALTRVDKSGESTLVLQIIVTGKTSPENRSRFLNALTREICVGTNNRNYMLSGGSYLLNLTSPSETPLSQVVDRNICTI